MARWLAIDHGRKRWGLAIGDDRNGIATPLTVLAPDDDEHGIAQLRDVLGEYPVDGIVVGWPLNMDGTEGPQARLARSWATRVENSLGREVLLWDERLTSYQADVELAGLFTRGKRKGRRDAVAAAALLREFLAVDGPARAPRASQASADDGREEGSGR
jgi:putative Holliday junction resolvase